MSKRGKVTAAGVAGGKVDGDGEVGAGVAEVGRERFEAMAGRALGELRGALAGVVETAPGPVRRAVDVQRALGIDAPLAWRIFKVVSADDPLLAAAFVPSRGQLLRFLEAAEGRGLPGRVVERARGAIEGYEGFCREHAGDRGTLDAMIAALRPGDEGQIDEKTRRGAFTHNARIWGLQAQTAVRAFIIYPGRDASVLGTAAVAGLVGFHAVRPDVPLVVNAVSRFESAGKDGDPAVRGLPTEDRSGLLLEFSSEGLEYRVEPGDDQSLVTRVCATGIGRRAAVTTFSLTTSEVGSSDLNKVTLGHGTSTPVEACQLELLVPAGLTDPRTARVAVYGRRTRVDRVIELRPADLIPVRATVAHLGAMAVGGMGVGGVAEVPPLAGVARWPEVVRHVVERVGAGGTRFDVYRCRVAYPVLHTLVCMQVDAKGG